MINLLPRDKKQTLVREYRIRWARVALGSVALVSLMGVASLAPSFATISYRSALFKTDAQKIEERITILEREKQPLSKQAEVRRRIALLVPSGEVPMFPSDLLSTVAQLKTSGVRLDTVSYSLLAEKKGEANGKISVAGFAEDRAALLRFVGALESEKRFVSVDSPISNLVHDKSLRFTLEILTR